MHILHRSSLNLHHNATHHLEIGSKWLRYSKIGSKILNMLEFTLQHCTPTMDHSKAPAMQKKITCDAQRCIFQHVGDLAPDFRISQILVVRFSYDFQYNDGHFITFYLRCESKFPGKYCHRSNENSSNLETSHLE